MYPSVCTCVCSVSSTGAKYNAKTWMHPTMRAHQVRPRFVPGVEVGNVLDLSDAMAGLQNLGDAPSAANAFLFAAAREETNFDPK